MTIKQIIRWITHTNYDRPRDAFDVFLFIAFVVPIVAVVWSFSYRVIFRVMDKL